MSTLEQLTLQNCNNKGWITQLYEILRENNKESCENKRQAWIQDVKKRYLIRRVEYNLLKVANTNHKYPS